MVDFTIFSLYKKNFVFYDFSLCWVIVSCTGILEVLTIPACTGKYFPVPEDFEFSENFPAPRFSLGSQDFEFERKTSCAGISLCGFYLGPPIMRKSFFKIRCPLLHPSVSRGCFKTIGNTIVDDLNDSEMIKLGGKLRYFSSFLCRWGRRCIQTSR